MLQLAEGVALQFQHRFGVRQRLGLAAKLVERDVRRDREHPGAQMAPVLEPVVRTQSAQERLLPCIFGPLAEEPAQVAEHLVAVRDVETLERRNLLRHDSHHLGNVAGCRVVRCAVVGHVEWVEFVRVARMPAAGEIAHGGSPWQEAAGGGAVMARQIARLNGQCEFFTALGDDEIGRRSERRLAELGVDVHAVRFGESRRGWVHVDDAGERTITTLGAKLLPRGPLPLRGYDAVFFVSGEVEALQSARAARFLAATARELTTLKAAGVKLDLLTASARDPGEQVGTAFADTGLDVDTVVLTEGPAGGTANGEPYHAAPLPGPVVDTYGAGDSFGAALCFALGRGDDLHAALDLATRAGAAVVTGAGPYATQLVLPA